MLLISRLALWAILLSALLPALSLAQTPILTDYRLPPEKLRKAEALYRTGTALYLAGTLYGFAVLVLLLRSGASVKFRNWAESATSRRWVQALVFAPLLYVSIDLLTLPLSIYSHHLQQSYGLSIQSWPSWWGDWLKGELLNTALATGLVWALYALIRHSPKRWWLYGWLSFIPLLLLLVFIQPIFVDPLFHHFDPLEAKQPRLLREIEKVMQRGGLEIPRDRIFEMQASDQYTTYNAYVTGLGSSKRVVIWDTTSRHLTIPETMFVFAHEQGHYVLHHLWQGMISGIAGFLAAIHLAYRLVHGMLARWGPRYGVRGVDDWASLPFFLLLLSLFTTLGQPIGNAISRYLEHQADIYALEAIHGLVADSPQVAAHTFQKLGENALAYPHPHPLYVGWVYTHPPIADRLRFSLTYQPWKTAQPLRYLGSGP